MSTAHPRVLGDRYKLGKLIARGGMADVYQAEDTVLEREVAIKLLRDISDDGAEQGRFRAEAHTLAGLSHPGLVTLLDAGFDDDHPFLVMDLVRGSSLAGSQDRARPPEVVAELGAQVADALDYVHAAGIIHRDVKPANILIAEGGRALLVDFGIAKLLSQRHRHTGAGLLVGTAAYLAPEQVRQQDVTPASDVYALGLVLLELAQGERIYTGSPIEAALARLHAPPSIPAWLPGQLRDLLRSMIRMEPSARVDAAHVAKVCAALSHTGRDSGRQLGPRETA